MKTVRILSWSVICALNISSLLTSDKSSESYIFLLPAVLTGIVFTLAMVGVEVRRS